MHSQQQVEHDKPKHPFEYAADKPFPFSALPPRDFPSSRPLANMHRDEDERPQSEVLSRGAGIRYMTQPDDVEATEREGSVGMGTFGRETYIEPDKAKASVDRYLEGPIADHRRL
jgi:hypothetical protein